MEDPISPTASLCVSMVTFSSALIRLAGCWHLPGSRALQWIVCLASVFASGGILGVAFWGRFDSDAGYQEACLNLLLVNCGLSGIYEAEFLLSLYEGMKPSCRWYIIAGMVLVSALDVGLCASILQGHSIRWIFIVLHSLICGTYIILTMGNGYIYHQARSATRFQITTPMRLARIFALGNICVCCSIAILAVAFLSVGGAGSNPNNLVLYAWVYFAISSVCTLRLPAFKWQKNKIKKLMRRNLKVELHGVPNTGEASKLNSYTLVRLSKPKGYTVDETIRRIDEEAGLHQVLSIARSLEMVVLKSYLSEFEDGLRKIFPGSNIHLDFDPFGPSKSDIARLGYNEARIQAIHKFSIHAEEMIRDAWPRAIAFYNYMVEHDRLWLEENVAEDLAALRWDL